jgi:hypothetical protein
MQASTLKQRAMLYLYGAPNMVGCLLAIGGLGMFFGGMIHAYWWAIVAGLYGAGVVGWPRNELAETAQTAELSTDLLAQQVRKLVDSVAKGLPKEALDELREIESTLKELLPRMRQMQDGGAISAKESFTVLETVRRYLPDTLGAYLRLPKLYAHMQTLGDQQTASQLLTSQLKMLKESLREIAKNAFAGEAEKLVTNGRFLQAKFSEVTAFRP